MGKENTANREEAQTKKAGLLVQTGLFNLIPAATYVPTQLPVQYHRPGEA
jgi:hypothetical protein